MIKQTHFAPLHFAKAAKSWLALTAAQMPLAGAAPYGFSGVTLPGADCLQSVSGNSRVLDTLDTKLRVEAYYQSGSLSPAVEQLESGAWNSQLLRLDVQLEAVPGSWVTTWSIPGVCCTSPHSPAIPSHSTRPSLADSCC